MKAQERITQLRASLEQLALAPPQSLLLEGGNEQARMEMALFWAKTANCPQALAQKAAGQLASPCGSCPVCMQIDANENLDLLIYDGRISNKQDEDKPGPVRALRMENMRELKSMTATAPHGAGKRVAIFAGMSQTREEALNSLLKTLEEPTDNTLFVLLAPQREQILPTLVSRSFCLTLPWNDSLAREEQIAEWEETLAYFLASGSGFLDKAAGKGALDAGTAASILLCCQRALARILTGRGRSKIDKALAPLAQNAKKAALANRWLGEAQAMLAANVTPSRTLEALAARLFTLLRA